MLVSVLAVVVLGRATPAGAAPATTASAAAVTATAGTSAAAGSVERAVDYLQARQRPDGGFAEPGRQSDPALTAWAVLGLAAAGRPPSDAAAYLIGKPYPSATDLALRILALDALGREVSGLARQLEGLRRSNGQIGPLVNSTIWGIIALRAAGRTVPAATVSWLRRAQRANGGWAWGTGQKPDADDTAAAVQALRAAGIPAGAKAVRRGLAFLRARQNADGGFESDTGRGSNAQTTAWAIQGFLAAGRSPGAGAYRYLESLQRADGSFRLSRRYVTTPVWVTAQVTAALARRHFPLR
ncbi:MAG: prenyltransferase/squalene oxidase repeat-containing protein [Gaiellales bacterium]